MSDGIDYGLDEVTDIGSDDEEDADGGDPAGPEAPIAAKFGKYAGIVPGIVAVYTFFFGGTRLLAPSPEPNDLFLTGSNVSGGNPMIPVAVVIFFMGILAGVAYVFHVDSVEESHRGEMAINLLFGAAAVGAIGVLLVIFEPSMNNLLVGDITWAVIYFVVGVIVIAIAIGSNLGLLAMVLIFGIFLGLPAYVGVFLGTYPMRLLVGSEDAASTAVGD